MIFLSVVDLTLWAIWLILAILFLGIEIATFNLVTIWFSISSIIAMVLALLGVGVVWQIVAFIVSSIALIFLFFAFREKLGLSSKSIDKTNADRNIGMTGIVTQKIDNIEATGQVKVNGQIWTAHSVSDEVIEVDELIEVVEIKGVKLFVKRKEL